MFRLCELTRKIRGFSVEMYRNSVMMVLGALINAVHGAVICAAPARIYLPWCTLTSHIKTNIQYICANATIFIFHSIKSTEALDPNPRTLLWSPKGAGRGGKCLLQLKQMETIINYLELCFGTNYHVCFDLVEVGGWWD